MESVEHTHTYARMHAKSLQTYLTATLWTVACQAPLSIGFFQASILEWVAISLSNTYIYTLYCKLSFMS